MILTYVAESRWRSRSRAADEGSGVLRNFHRSLDPHSAAYLFSYHRGCPSLESVIDANNLDHSVPSPTTRKLVASLGCDAVVSQ